MRGLVCLVALALAPAAAHAQPGGDPLPPGAVARLGSVRFHHPGTITAVAFSPDGKSLLVAGYEDGKHSVRYWDAVSGKELARFGVERYVHGAAFLPDGKHVVLATDKGLHLHERSGKHVRTFGDGELESWALSPDGTVLAAHPPGWEQESPIRLWELATGKELPALSGRGAGWYGALRFSADGKRLVCRAVVPNKQGDSDIGPGNTRVVTVWDVAARKLLHERTVPNDDVALSPDGKTIALHLDGGVRTVHLPSGKQSRVLTSDARLLAFSPDGKALLTTEPGGAPLLWDVATGKELRTFAVTVYDSHRPPVFAPDGSAVALVWSRGQADDSTVTVLDVATGKARRAGDGHQAPVRCAAVAPGGKLLASGDDDGTVLVWDLASRKPLARLEGHSQSVSAVAISGDGAMLASASADGEVRLWDAAAGKLLARLAGPEFPWCLAFAADGKTLTVGTGQGQVRAWSVPAGKELRDSVVGDRSIVLAFGDGGALALTSALGPQQSGAGMHVALWPTARGRPLLTIPVPRPGRPTWLYETSAGAIAPSGRLLAWSQIRRVETRSGGLKAVDCEVRLCERTTGQELRPLADVQAAALAFSPDSRLLAGALRSKTSTREVGVWDVLTGEQRATLGGHQSWVGCVVFTPDGKYLISGGGDRTLLVWEVPAATAPRLAELPPGQLARWWDDLAEDAAAAYPALAGFVDYPAQALPWLRKHLRPAPAVDSRRIADLVAALDSPTFKERQKAAAALEEFGALAEPALRKALAGEPPLELRRRADLLLARIEQLAPLPAELRALRAVMALEMIGSDDGRRLLEALARGAPEARLTREAAAALGRLARREMP
jgi:WD40 repeat protein